MPDSPRLEVDQITCRFDGRDVVREVSFEVRAGEILCLLGPSGCGKSTTLRVVAGIERQVAGAVRADGMTLSDDSIHLPPEARGVGLIFQDFALFPHLTVAQNVAFGLRGARSATAARVAELLERVDLAGYADKPPHMLSGGEQQRVALARALAPRPRIIDRKSVV
jgi:iron(III) transport system ATP-binding protein